MSWHLPATTCKTMFNGPQRAAHWNIIIVKNAWACIVMRGKLFSNHLMCHLKCESWNEEVRCLSKAHSLGTITLGITVWEAPLTCKRMTNFYQCKTLYLMLFLADHCSVNSLMLSMDTAVRTVAVCGTKPMPLDYWMTYTNMPVIPNTTNLRCSTHCIFCVWFTHWF